MPSHNPQDWAPPAWTPSPWSEIKPLPSLFSECSKQLQEVAERLSAERAAAQSKLTKEQFVEAMRQALACGDFMRYVRIDNDGQMVTYEPFREVSRLRRRLEFMERGMKAIYKIVAEDEAPT